MKRIAPALLALALVASAGAQSETPYPVPDSMVDVTGGAISFHAPGFRDTYVSGLGWLSGADLDGPTVQDGTVRVGHELADLLGLAAGAGRAVGPSPSQPGGATAVRFGGSGQVRVVLDLPELPDASALRRLETNGELAEGGMLTLDLPSVTLPPEQPDPYAGIDVTLLARPNGTRLELRGPPLVYKVFALEAPTRLVIDLVPRQTAPVVAEARSLRPGVSYRRFGAPTPVGDSVVHLLEIAPGSGEFRVVGATEEARTLSELADGAFAAINAGYFDTSTFQAIGLLRVDFGIQSLPSRNRASIGFGLDGPVMQRVQARVGVRLNGRLVHQEELRVDDGLQLHYRAGLQAGAPSRGVLAVREGRVVANRVGPVPVPAEGFALVYPPDRRELALAEPGDLVSLEVDFAPDAFDAVRYAVEAGPMLVEDGRPAFYPDVEAFKRGERILDAYTQQSAIGIRPDGTVLLLVAENMRAEDLVPLFLSLGAEDAMRLDSGSSATLFAGGKVLNRQRERRIVSAIVFVPSGS